MYKLPIFRIIAGALIILWYNKFRFSRTLALVAVLAIWIHIGSEIPASSSTFLLLYWTAFSIFAVTCQRLSWIDDHNSNKQYPISLSRREFRFLVSIIAVYLERCKLGIRAQSFLNSLCLILMGSETLSSVSADSSFTKR